MAEDKSEAPLPAPAAIDSPVVAAVRKPCPLCGEDIAASAKKCIHCGSDLNWRRYLSFSSTTLALLTALIAVAGALGPSIKSLFDYRDAFMTFTYVGAGSLRTVQPDGRPTNGTVILLGSNEGHHAGGLVAADVVIVWQTNGKRHVASSALRTAGDEPLVIAPGASVAVRLLNDPEVDPEKGTTAADVQALIVPTKNDDPESAPFWSATCRVRLSVAGMSQDTSEISIPARCPSLMPALRDAIRRPGVGI